LFSGVADHWLHDIEGGFADCGQGVDGQFAIGVHGARGHLDGFDDELVAGGGQGVEELLDLGDELLLFGVVALVTSLEAVLEVSSQLDEALDFLAIAGQVIFVLGESFTDGGNGFEGLPVGLLIFWGLAADISHGLEALPVVFERVEPAGLFTDGAEVILGKDEEALAGA